MNYHNKKLLPLLLISVFTMIACNEKPQQKVEQKAEQQTVSEVKTAEIIEIPTTVQSTILVNNNTPEPQGYHVDITHLKEPKLIDFNGDGKLDAFRVLKNPNKKGMKYLFEFRIADSDKVYFYENDEKGYDLDIFGKFDTVKTGDKFVDAMQLDGDLMDYDHAPQNARLILENDAIKVNVLEETCAASLFFLENDKIRRIYLC